MNIMINSMPSDASPIALPKEWRQSRLSNVVTVKGGKRLPKGDSFASSITPFPYIRIVDFHEGTVRTNALNYLKPSTQKSIRNYTISKNDVYISIAGTIGLVGVIPEFLDGANLTENAAKLVIRDKEELDKDFLAFYLTSSSGKEQINNLTAKTSQPKLALVRIEQIQIPLPPLAEQRAIASTLRAAQATVQARHHAVELERERKAALMQALFTKGTRGEATKTTEIGEVPESWEVVPLGRASRLESGGTPSKERPDWWQGTVPWVSPKDIKQPRLRNVADYITEEALASSSRLAPAGTLFIVVRGMILAKDIPVALAEVPMAFNQDLKAIMPDNTNSSRGDRKLGLHEVVVAR